MKANARYETLTGRTIAVHDLSHSERDALGAVVEKYKQNPEWSEFASWWIAELGKRKVDRDSSIYKICDDLEARLGISQGKAAPPDYRDYLAALIDEHYPSRYEFCRDAEIDQGQLSRILAGKADFSIQLLSKITRLLQASLIIQSVDTLKQTANRKGATRPLEAVLPH